MVDRTAHTLTLCLSHRPSIDAERRKEKSISTWCVSVCTLCVSNGSYYKTKLNSQPEQWQCMFGNDLPKNVFRMNPNINDNNEKCAQHSHLHMLSFVCVRVCAMSCILVTNYEWSPVSICRSLVFRFWLGWIQIQSGCITHNRNLVRHWHFDQPYLY